MAMVIGEGEWICISVIFLEGNNAISRIAKEQVASDGKMRKACEKKRRGQVALCRLHGEH